MSVFFIAKYSFHNFHFERNKCLEEVMRRCFYPREKPKLFRLSRFWLRLQTSIREGSYKKHPYFVELHCSFRCRIPIPIRTSGFFKKEWLQWGWCDCDITIQMSGQAWCLGTNSVCETVWLDSIWWPGNDCHNTWKSENSPEIHLSLKTSPLPNITAHQELVQTESHCTACLSSVIQHWININSLPFLQRVSGIDHIHSHCSSLWR